jgi:hypothetical protein
MTNGINRVRISTTVDARAIERARILTGARDSTTIDRALLALIDQLEGRRERAALLGAPYEHDEELTLPDPSIDWATDLPYDGAVPPQVLAMAERRRRSNR